MSDPGIHLFRVHHHHRAEVVKPLGEADLPPVLHGLYRHYMRELGLYMETVRPSLNRFLGLGGTTSNIEQTATWVLNKFLWAGTHVAPAADGSDAATFDERAKNAFRAGCEAVSSKTVAVLQAYILGEPKLKGWKVYKVMVGNVLEHHATALQPIKASEDDAFVFDPWITQAPEVYTMAQWRKEFRHWAYLGSPRSEW